MQGEWIEWNGGECPVPKGTLVDVRLRSGVEGFGTPAGEWGIGVGTGNAAARDWQHTGVRGDIIAYRLHQPAAPSADAEKLTADELAAWTTFAAAALQGLLAAYAGHTQHPSYLPAETHAAEAVSIADALMAERAKRAGKRGK